MTAGNPGSRILVIDDNPSIHADFRKIFGAGEERPGPSVAEAELFGGKQTKKVGPDFMVDWALQGEEGLALVQHALDQKTPYSLAFVDVRMPPGMDGIETTAAIWQVDPNIQIVICTAYSDFSWTEMMSKLGRSDRLVILKKPFDAIEVLQLASALTEKWRLARHSRMLVSDLERRVMGRTRELKQAGERLRASEAQYRLLFDGNPLPMWVYDEETLRFLAVNGAAVAHYGFSVQQFLAMTVRDFQPAEEVDEVENRADQASVPGKRSGPARHRKRDGTVIDVEISSDSTVFDGRPARLVLARDVSDQKLAEMRIKRLNRVYAVLSGIDALIVRIRDRDELLSEVCRVAVVSGQFRLAWIGVFDPVTLVGKIVASAGVDGADTSGIVRETERAGPALNCLPASRATRDRKAVVCNDIATDPDMVPEREQALARGYRSLAAFPLASRDSLHGVLVLYGAQTDFFDPDEIKLLNDLAANISFALDDIEKEGRLAYVSYYDTLTGLANRRLFFDRLKQMMLTATADRGSLAIVVIELQRVRHVNETLGRSAGDRLVMDFSARLVETLGNSITPARMSDDRFAAVIADKTGADLAVFVRRCAIALHMKPLQIDGVELRAAVKFGIAMFPADGADPEILFRNAEGALRQAHDTVENYVFYSEQVNAAVARRLRLEGRLRQAVEKKQFVVHYQPKVDLKNGRIVGLEALLRWHDPEHGLISPVEFVPLLEETGMIVAVGFSVIEQAVADMRLWASRKLLVPRVAVNVSQMQLRQRNFVSGLFGVLASSGRVEPERNMSVTQILVAEDVVSDYEGKPIEAIGLDIEITESMIATDNGGNIEKLQQLRAAGIGIYIDDFGTGYSSLSQLAQLPIDALKIDRAFVVNMEEGAGHMAIVSTIINLAKSLNVIVLAEGVETQRQANLLRSLGCDQAQGFLYGKPLSAEHIPRLLTARESATGGAAIR